MKTEAQKLKDKEEKKRKEKVNRTLESICDIAYTEYDTPIYTLSARKVAAVIANLIL